MPNSRTIINDAEAAYDIVIDAIVTQKLAPSQKVSEKILSEKFGISRTIARNLIEHLIAKQFLSSVSERITTVAPLTLLEVKQNFALRKILLPDMVALASSKADYNQLYALNDEICSMLPIEDDVAALKVLKANMKLNLSMYEKAGYPLMLDWAHQLENMTMRIYWLYIKTNKIFPYSGDQQKHVFDVMKDDSPAETKKAFYDSLAQTEERIINAIFSHEQFYTQDLKV
jgi:DNA-binding GntR family transcriptional regulator